MAKLYHLYFYVPKSHLEKVKNAIFEAGAGKMGNYDKCSWQTEGLGQFCPLGNSNPHIGAIGNIETVVEYKVETVVAGSIADKVIKALKSAHPYETPAFGLVELNDFSNKNDKWKIKWEP